MMRHYQAIRKGPDGTLWLWFHHQEQWKPVTCCGATHEPLPDNSPPTEEEQTLEHEQRLLFPRQYQDA